MSYRVLSAALLIAAGSGGAPAPTSAQDPAELPDSLPAYLLEGIVVTSTRAPALRYDIPQKIDVVTGSDLERTIAKDLTGALKKNTAVEVIEYPGFLSGVSIRGFRPQFSGINARTLILIDGRPAGVTNLATLDLAGVERVEVLKGPASALYGSNAMGGVVNVITRRSTGTVGGSISGRYGSYGTYRTSAGAGGSLGEKLDFDIAVSSAARTDGYRTGSNRLIGEDEVLKTLPLLDERRTLPETLADTTVSFSEYSTRAGDLRLGYELTDRWRLDLSGGFFAGGELENPGDLTSSFPFPTLNDLERHTGELKLTGAVGRHDLSGRVFGSRETTSYYDSAEDPSFISFRSPIEWRGMQLQDVVDLGSHLITAGADYLVAEAETESFSAAETPRAPYNPNSAIRSAAAFAEARFGLMDDRLVATLGGRFDRITLQVLETPLLANAPAGKETHSVFNPSAGVLFEAGRGLRLHATAGRAFVTPDAFAVAGYVERQQFGRSAVVVTRGNPELDPESSVTWDAGISLFRPRRGVDADVTYFRTRVRDRIAITPLPTSGTEITASGDTIVGVSSYRNVDRSEISGIEARIGYDLGASAAYDYSLRFFANANGILEAEEISGTSRADITHVADLTAVLGVEYDDRRRFSGRLSGRYIGERTAPDYNDWQNVSFIHYPRFLVLDLTTRVRIGDRYTIGLLLENLNDENYYEVRGYNLPGRSVQVQAGVSF